MHSFAHRASSSGGADRTRGQGHSGQSHYRGGESPRINGIEDANSAPSPPPPLTSSIHALFSRSRSHHRNATVLGLNPMATTTRMNQLIVHPTAPRLPSSQNGNGPHGNSSSSSQRATSRFWTQNVTSNTTSGPLYPVAPSESIPSHVTARPSAVSAPRVFSVAAHCPYPPTQDFLPTPAQTPRVSSFSSPSLDRTFLSPTQTSSVPRPFNSRGSTAFGGHFPSQHIANLNESPPAFSPSPRPHFRVPPPRPPPPVVFNQQDDDQTPPDHDRHQGPDRSPSPVPRADPPPPTSNVIAEFRARLKRQHPASQIALQAQQSVFSWDNLSTAVESTPQAALGHRLPLPEEVTDQDNLQSVSSNVFSDGTRVAAGTLGHENDAEPPQCPVRGRPSPPPLPTMPGPRHQRSEGMVTAMQLAVSNGGRLPVKPVSDLPPRFRSMFSFPYFNYIQTQCYDHLMHSDTNFVTSAPTGSGKTALLDLALIRLWTTHPTSRAVYLAPTKALCSERAADWTRRLQPLGITVAELTGDTSLFDARGAHAAHLLVITSEKYDAVTRRWRESARTRQFVAQVGLVLLDEVHLLASSRGATLEALVARMKIVSAELRTTIRYVALSATFPNIDDVGTWLGGAAKVYKFGDEYRPVRLERLVLGFSAAHRSSWQFEKVLDGLLPNVIHEHAAGKPALVFCATRKAAEATAKLLVAGGNGRMPGSMGHPFVRTVQHARTLSEAAQRVRSHAARDLVVHGVAFHHAGVEMADRQLIERLFLAGHLLTLCTTSTLAVGVNLPAYLVVLKGTQFWTGGEMKEYAPMDVLQMLGRAGRPQFETSGKAVIMTTSNKVEEYESLVTGRTVVESSLHVNLIEHLNAEIAQGTITNEQLAVQWLESTFLHVRLRAAPFYYANVVHGSDNLRQLVASTLKVLTAAEMVRQSQLTPEVAAAVSQKLECTEYGKLMSRYCLSLQTMQALMAGGPSLPQQLYSMALAGEFSGTYVKAGDKTMLAELNKMQGIKFRLPDKYKYKSTADKVFLVVQAVLGGVQLQGKDMDRLRVFVSCEQSNIWSAMGRIAAAAVDLHVARRDTVPLAADRIRYSILLLQSIRSKIWFDSTRVLRQVDKLGPVLTSTLAEAGITTFSELASAQAWRLEQLCRRNPPFGTGLITAANHFPCLDVVGGFIQSTILLSVTISNAATCKKGPHGGASWVHVLVHDEVGKILFHDRATLFNLAKSEYKKSITLSPSIQCVFASLLVEDYVGLDVHLQADPRTRQVSIMPRWLLLESAFSPPDMSALFAPAASQLAGPIPPPIPVPYVGPLGPPPPLIGSSTLPPQHPPAMLATTGFMMAYQPPVPPIPPQSTHDAAQSLCKHKCKDRHRCKHACCKRGLADRSPTPIRPAKPAPKQRKKQLTLEQILQGIPEPVVVLSDSDDDSDAEDVDIFGIIDHYTVPVATARPTRLPPRKLTPPPPPMAHDLDDEWHDFDDSVFWQAASLDMPQLVPPSDVIAQAPAPQAHAQAPLAPLSSHFDRQCLAPDQQQLTPPHTDTPSGDQIPTNHWSLFRSPRDSPEQAPQPQTHNRHQATLSGMPHRPAIPTTVAQPGFAHAPGTAGGRVSMQGFRFRADLLPRAGSSVSVSGGSQSEGSE